jgi:hypothetical protein
VFAKPFLETEALPSFYVHLNRQVNNCKLLL